jgi:hypothetical protein
MEWAQCKAAGPLREARGGRGGWGWVLAGTGQAERFANANINIIYNISIMIYICEYIIYNITQRQRCLWALRPRLFVVVVSIYLPAYLPFATHNRRVCFFQAPLLNLPLLYELPLGDATGAIYLLSHKLFPFVIADRDFHES